MTQFVLNTAVLLASILVFGVLRLKWRPLDFSRLIRFPMLLGVLGLVSVGSSLTTTHLGPEDGLFFALQVVLAVGVGAATGRVSQIRPLSAGTDFLRTRRGLLSTSSARITMEMRTPWPGLALWVAFIVIRLGFHALAAQAGSSFGASTAVVILLLAANRGTFAAVLHTRARRANSAPLTSSN